MSAPRVAMRTSTGVTYLHSDHLGSTNVASNGSGALISRQTYFPFGAPRASDTAQMTAVTDFGFTGQKLDASDGLMYYNARYYDAALGRFIQPDTIVPNPYNPQALNRYSYVYNNPLRYTDPSGHGCEMENSCEDKHVLAFDSSGGSSGGDPDIDGSKLQAFILMLGGASSSIGAFVPADPPDSLSTKEFIKKYRDAQAQIKSACIDAGCYNEDHWYMVDPFVAWDDEHLALLIEESKSAYWAAGLNFHDLVNKKLNNTLDLESLKPSQYGNLILEFVMFKMNPVTGQFLWELNLDTVHYAANHEPMFVMAHIASNPLLYIRTVDACLHSEHCGQYGGPITILK